MGWRPLVVSVIGLAPGCAVSAVDLDNLDLNQPAFKRNTPIIHRSPWTPSRA